MVDAGDTMMLEPEPTSAPPQLPLYQRQLAAVPRLPPFTLSVAEPPAHSVVVVVLMDVAAADMVFMLMVTLEHAVVLQVPSART